MPSLTAYVHQIVSEEKYGEEVVKHTHTRMEHLNDTQLIGMVNHLKEAESVSAIVATINKRHDYY